MDRITVAELATECSVQNKVVLTELKRLGLYVFSPSATIDPSFAETIRKKILSQREAAEAKLAEAEKKKEKEAEAARKAEKKQAKEVEKKKPAAAKAVQKEAVAAPPAKAPAPRKGKKAAPVEVKKEVEEPLKPSLAPRKGRKHYDREAAILVEGPVVEAPKEPEVGVPEEAVPEAMPPVEAVPDVVAPAAEARPELPVARPEELVPAAVIAAETQGSPAAPIPEPPPVEAAAAHPAGVVHAPGMVSKKVVVRKAKSQILMRTATEKVVTPEISDRILRGLREEKPTAARTIAPARVIRRKRPERAESPAARVIEFPRPPATPEEFKPISITEGVTLKELAEKMDIKSKYIIQKLISKGILASINQTLDLDIAKEVCAEFGFKADVISFEREAEIKQEVADRREDYVARPPVVTIMGHVDHGKTSLLDAIRETNVTATEVGGITQHIGAYQVDIKSRGIVFLDTPGHEAFTLMRARGAQATDIVVLVVAADDGVMPQTIEAIHHAKAANVPIIVAINKIDKPGAQPDRVKQSLSEQGLLAEDWGGDVVTVPVSAKMKSNLDLLLEMILLVADMKDLKANPLRLAAGVVLEAKVDKGRGCVATVLVQTGSLHVGDSFVAGAVHGRVRALINDRGTHIAEAGPSMPVEIQGLQDLPQAGDTFQVFEDAAKARQVAEYRQTKLREQSLRSSARLSLQALFQQMREGKVKELPLILKADVQGSVEVLTDMLNKLSTDKVKVRILHGGAGAVTETDVLLASASNAIIIGFNVRPERKAQELAENEGVEIRLYTVIYNVTNDIKNAMIGMLEYTTHEKYLGRAEVRDTFRVPKYGFIAGSYIVDGIIRRNAAIRLLRDNVVIHEGKIGSLRRFKDDVSEVKSGYECGIGFEHFSDIKIGDVIEAYIIEKIQPTSL
ncbi:MAG: bacterial translation initiation factor 2 (bIF-2) [Acidobacteria bacterium]|nr:bacterial translation initiation factor 2 (bIF-2) [Acidobacteriota bacterium]